MLHVLVFRTAVHGDACRPWAVSRRKRLDGELLPALARYDLADVAKRLPMEVVVNGRRCAGVCRVGLLLVVLLLSGRKSKKQSSKRR